MIDPEHLRQILNHSLHLTAKEINVVRLPGDASNRSYHRLSWKENGSLQSLILMVLAGPEGFKASEEAISGAPPPTTELPFVNIQRHLRTCKVAVPEIFFYDPARGWLLLEDLGDVTLAQEVQNRIQDKATLLSYYHKAIDELLTLQLEASPISASPTIAHYRIFDQALFMWEFDHFIEYGIEKRKGIVLPEKGKTAIRAYFSDMALRLASLPRVLTHRDYHSRNLMIQPQPSGFKIRVIDFQDALMGPCQYDLASLLRDSYIDLPEEMIDDLVQYYLEQWGVRSGEKIGVEATPTGYSRGPRKTCLSGVLPLGDPVMFRELFDLASIQRNLKAAGRFVYIHWVKKNDRFLPYVQPTLAKVKRNLQKHRKLAPLHTLLAEYVEELQ